MNMTDFEMLNYIDELIASNEIDVAMKLLNKFPISQVNDDFKNYLFGLCYIKQKPQAELSLALEHLNLIQNETETILYLKIYCKFYIQEYEDLVGLYLSNSKIVHNEDILLLLGLSHEKLNLLKGAKKIYYDILNLNKENKQAYNNLIGVLMRMNNLDEILLLSKNQLFKNLNPEVCNNLAISLIMSGKERDGLDLFENILTGEDEFIMSQDTKCKIVNNYINQLIKLGFKEKAELILEDNYQEDPTGIQVLMYGNIKLEQKKEGDALVIFKNYLKHNTLNQQNKQTLNFINTFISSNENKQDLTLHNTTELKAELQNTRKNHEKKRQSISTGTLPSFAHHIIKNNSSSNDMIKIEEVKKEQDIVDNSIIEEPIEEAKSIKNDLIEENKSNIEEELVNPTIYEIKELKETNENIFRFSQSESPIINKVDKDQIAAFFDEIKISACKRIEEEEEINKANIIDKRESNDLQAYSNERVDDEIRLSNNYNSYKSSRADTPQLNYNPTANSQIVREEIDASVSNNIETGSNNVLFASFKDTKNDERLEIDNQNPNPQFIKTEPKVIEEDEEVETLLKSLMSSFNKEKLIYEMKNPNEKKFEQTKAEVLILGAKKLNEDHKKELAWISSQVAKEQEDFISISNLLFNYFKKLNEEQLEVLINALKKCQAFYKLAIIHEHLYYCKNKSIEIAWDVINYSALSNTYDLFNQFGFIVLSDQSTYNKNLSKLIEFTFKGGLIFNDYLDGLVEQFKKSVSEHSEGSMYYYFAGRNSLRKKNNNSAYEYFVRIENDSLFQKNINYLKAFAKTCAKLKNNKKALKLYKAALKINNNDFESCLNIGECYLKLDNIERSSKYLIFCKSLEATTDEKNKLYFAMGRLLYKQRHFQGSIDYFEKCIKADSQSYRSYHNIALILMEMNEKVKAKEYFEKCIQIQPSYNIAHFEVLALELSTVESTIEKNKIKERFDSIINNLQSQYLDYAKILIENFNNPQEAIQYISKALNTKDLSFGKAIDVIAGLFKDELYQESYDLFTQLIKKSEKDYKIYLKISLLFQKVKKYNFAIKIMKQFITDFPQNFNAMYEMSTYYIKDKNFQSALKYLHDTEELYSIDNKYNGFLKAMAYCYLEIGFSDKAFNEISKHHAKLPEESNNLIMAYIKSSQSNEKEAKIYLKNELELFPLNNNLKEVHDEKDLKNVNWRELFNYN